VPTLEAAFAAGGVHLISVPIDYTDNVRVLVEQLRDRVGAAERSPVGCPGEGQL
jgi:acetolactate synthase-1/2/3 large subunit